MTPLDPMQRWREIGLDEKPDFAGLPSFAGLPYTENPQDLVGVDAAILGAPTDDLVSDRPGTRFAPRGIRAASCPPGPHLEEGTDWSQVLRVIDYGDAPVVPADPARTHAAIQSLVEEVDGAGALPIVLGGDHSITEANIKALVKQHGPLALIHFDTHTDTGQDVFGAEMSHGTPMYRLVRDGHVVGEHYVQIGLRGYWPGQKEFNWQKEQGIQSLFMHQIRDHGIKAVVRQALDVVGDKPCFLSIDIDVLDPAFAPGTGTPEPGGMTSTDLLWAARSIAKRANLVGMDLVEVIPSGVGSADITCLTAERVVREALTGLAWRRQGQQRKA